MVYAPFGINSTIKKKSPVYVLLYCLSFTLTCPCFIMSLDVCHNCSRVSRWWRWTFFSHDLTWFWRLNDTWSFLSSLCLQPQKFLAEPRSPVTFLAKKNHYCLLYWASSFHLSSFQLAYFRYTLIFSLHPCLYHPL